ncbi:MAG: DMT family transporter [Clostridia bacterium]|nr:DMT family transporter [Clostridia bacterium]
MWLLCALATFLSWGAADLFYKKGADETDRYSHLKTSVMVGLVMGVTAFATLLIKGIDYDPRALLVYFPVSAMYILSMVVGYFGLRYLELSVSSPIQNASGAVSCVLLILVLRELPDVLSLIAVVLITAGVVLLGVFEKRKEDDFLRETDKKYKIGFAAFLMPVLYCVIDSLGTFLDGYYLDDWSTSPLRAFSTEETLEDVANISYQLTFLAAALILFVFLRLIKKERMPLRAQGSRGLAALFETAGQLTYVWAMSGNGVVAAPLIASYCVCSVVLARLFLREKLTWRQYICVGLVFGGILLLGIVEGLAE